MLEIINQVMAILAPIALAATLLFSGCGLILTLKALRDAKFVRNPAARTGYRLLACLIGVLGVNMLMSACQGLAQYLAYMILTM